MKREELDNKISLLRTEKLMLIKSKAKHKDLLKIKAIEKRIVEVNKEMKNLREDYKKERIV